MLVHAICSETGANMFDLTATNIAGKYPGKDGLKLLMHMVFKVSASVDRVMSSNTRERTDSSCSCTWSSRSVPLSRDVIKYPGKDGLKLLMHLVFKVSASVA